MPPANRKENMDLNQFCREERIKRIFFAILSKLIFVGRKLFQWKTMSKNTKLSMEKTVAD